MDGTTDSRRRAFWKRPLVAFLGLAALGWSDPLAGDRSIAARDAEVFHPRTSGPTRRLIRGSDFPDGVLALTWDDGPDASTLDLARYLKAEKVSATFFVVGEWVDGTSEEPGVGTNVYETGYRHLPVLANLVALGHRVGSHTENHALLDRASALGVVEQLGTSMREIDAFLLNELRMFRAPGGAWSRSAAEAIADPTLADLVGPIHWDIDAKDWEGSLYCRSELADECEPGPIPGRSRVRAEVIARRYVAVAERLRHGIVLMHDRVGHVGSRYALDVARHLVPELQARGFVFAAPVLAFGAPSRRLAFVHGESDVSNVRFVDIDGDGRADVCREERGSFVCARASASTAAAGSIARARFEEVRPVTDLRAEVRALDIADVDGDGRADICVLTDAAIECALARASGTFGPLARWSIELTAARRSIEAHSFRLADVDGDRRVDACIRSAEGILCATSTGTAFGRPRLWLDKSAARAGSRLELADLDGDGRADLCEKHTPVGASSRPAPGITCALSSGRAFAHPSIWSTGGDFEGDGDVRLADINGDGRADACALGTEGVSCALSSGRAFKHASLWSDTRLNEIRLADVNGDGRADLCAVTKDHVDCGMAP